MANFDMDDPLGDLLSDGSNDSFFEEPKVTAKRASITKTPEKKKSVSELFGLDKSDAKKESAKKDDDDWLGLSTVPKPAEKPAVRPQSSKPVKKISFEDDDDVLNTLGLDKKPEPKTSLKTDPQKGAPKIDSAKKASLMESILGPSKHEEENLTSFGDILKASQAGKKTETRPTSAQKTLAPKQEVQSAYGATSLDAPREGRRSRQQPSALMDPLGLFSNEPSKSVDTESKKHADVPSPARRRDSASAKTAQSNWLGLSEKDDVKSASTDILFPIPKGKEAQTKSAPNLTELPNWLGDGPPIKPQKSDTVIAQSEPPAVTRRSSFSHNQVEAEVVNPDDSQIKNTPMIKTLMTQQKLAASNIEYQNAAVVLQQQESQLLMAMQLKKYEESLSGMQIKQQEVLVQQEQQFNSLLERHLAKQQVMESNMRIQQDRINSHIQMLLSQPTVSGPVSEEHERINELKKSQVEESSRLYEEIIAALKQRTHEEAFLLEESYKKQIATLEQTMEAVEARLKSEIENMQQQHREKNEKLQQDHESELLKYKQKIEEIAMLHVNEIKTIRDNHDRIVEEIKYEYMSMVEHIKKTKQEESALFQNSSEYNQKLDATLKFLDSSSRNLLDVREKVEKDYGVLSLAREESLKAKEEEIKSMRAALEKSRESAEIERAQLIALVRNLETKLAEQSQNSREDRWVFQQAAATLAARSAALDREAEFNRNSIDRERDQLKTLKESLLAEQEKLMLQLTEEKLSVSAEKARLETSLKLNQNYDSQRAKAELEAAIQVAKEAAEMTDRERETLLRQQREVESTKRIVVDRERKLETKERDLEVAMQNSERKTLEGERALAEARTIQSTYNERLKEIQSQLVSLTSREKRVAEEKISLSKERLGLYNQIRQAKRCSLCTIDTVPKITEEQLDYVEQDFTHIKNFFRADAVTISLAALRSSSTTKNETSEIEATTFGVIFGIIIILELF